MTARRLELQAILENLVGDGGSVYFQPPSSIQMTYPCIVYNRDTAHNVFADNVPYRHTTRYQVVTIAKDPDSDIPDKVAELPMCTLIRTFIVDNLNHDVFDLYY